MFVIVLLVAPALAMLAPAGAQAPAARSANLVIEDPVGDVGMFGVAGETPVSGAYGHVDITRLEVGNDDADSFQIMFAVAGFDDPAQTATQAIALNDYTCGVSWTYENGNEGTNYDYGVYFYPDVTRMPGSDPGEPTLEWYWSYRSENTWTGRWQTNWPGEIAYDAAQSVWVIDVPKSWAPVWPGAEKPAAGDVLLVRYADCSTDVVLTNRVYDWVDVDANSRYKFQSGGQGGDLEVSFNPFEGAAGGADPMDWQPGTEVTRVVSVAPDAPTKVPVYLKNEADSRKLAQLSASFEDPETTGWGLSLTPSVMVPAEDERTVNLIVTPPPDVAFGTTVPIMVNVETPGEPSVGVATGLLRVAPVLSAEHNKFHIHSRATGTSDAFGQVLGEVLTPHTLAVSLLEDLPDYDDEPADIGMLAGMSTSEYLDPLARPVRLDTADPVQIALAFEGDPSRMVRVELSLFADDETVFGVNQLVPGDGVTEIEAIVHGEGQRELPAGAELYMVTRVLPANIGPESASDVAFLAKESHFTLPVLQSSGDYVLTDGRFLPALSLARNEESTTYLNPDKEYAFDLVLANEGIETDDLHVSVNATNATGWDIDVKPGSKFRVTPGNSTPVSLVVRAPADASEGTRAVFDVIAQSTHDKAVRTTLKLDAIVTTGVEVEGKEYQDKEGQLDPLLDEGEEAPGPPFLLLVSALAGVGLFGRRRV